MEGGEEDDEAGAEEEEESLAVRAEEYAHSSLHYYVATGDQARLSAALAALPRLRPASAIRSAADAAEQDRLAEQISSVLDRRDVPRRETPLHLAVRLDRRAAVASLVAAGADASLQNGAGWTPLQECVLLGRPRHLSVLLLRHHHRSAWHKWRRRLPSLLAALRLVRDFYLELSFHFESSVVPFLPRVAPSDTYRIWKRGASLRADTSLAGFDGLRLVRADQSFLFLGGSDEDGGGELGLDADPDPSSSPVAAGSLLVLDHGKKELCDALEAARSPMAAADEDEFLADSSMYRPGLDITAADLVSRTNWRRKEKTETVAKWKARVYEMQNVIFSFKTRRWVAGRRRETLPLELHLDDDEEEGFLVAEIPDLVPSRHSSYEAPREDGHGGGGGGSGRRSVDVAAMQRTAWGRPAAETTAPRRKPAAAAKEKEKEVVKNLRPWVWLTEEFPLRAAELMPVLDVLAGKVKAVRRLRELLTTKFPPGTFPVKVAIPVIPTVRVVITFTKFVALPPLEQFFTPLSSPGEISEDGGDQEEEGSRRRRQSEDYGWCRRWGGRSTAASLKSVSPSPLPEELPEPFAIPSDYAWTSIAAKKRGMRRLRSRKVKYIS
ncbi:unnamed protein product [Spirodela intermedia]|uniref:Ankyrin repeat domain-containing protein n=1 Tax=Spirodela intermedia TaxID=51605 RepID=A0A7I8LIP6_SPIIN|nr:unnamed protein product [Spirodela intermedia]